MKQYLKRSLILLLLLLTAAVLPGCAGHRTAEGPEDGVYRIYYLNSTRSKMAAMEYRTDETDSVRLLEEISEQILTTPDDPDYQALLPEKVSLLEIKQQGNVLNLNFNKEYSSMKPTREILVRAAFAKTFTQLPDIEYISMTCEGQPLLDARQNPVGAFSGSDFVDNISDVNTFERVEIKLYFANETRDALVPETRELVYNMKTSLEKLVVEQLAQGSQTGNLPVMPKDTRILNVSMTDNTCYVNLDSRFLTGELEAAEYIPIYALVNSLTELKTVNKVQITVDGSADIMYRNSISLAFPFERDEKYIAGGK